MMRHDRNSEVERRLPICERADHPSDPHYHYGYGARYWSRAFPHWDVDARMQQYAKNQPPRVHPDMDGDKGWVS